MNKIPHKNTIVGKYIVYNTQEDTALKVTTWGSVIPKHPDKIKYLREDLAREGETLTDNNIMSVGYFFYNAAHNQLKITCTTCQDNTGRGIVEKKEADDYFKKHYKQLVIDDWNNTLKESNIFLLEEASKYSRKLAKAM